MSEKKLKEKLKKIFQTLMEHDAKVLYEAHNSALLELEVTCRRFLIKASEKEDIELIQEPCLTTIASTMIFTAFYHKFFGIEISEGDIDTVYKDFISAFHEYDLDEKMEALKRKVDEILVTTVGYPLLRKKIK